MTGPPIDKDESVVRWRVTLAKVDSFIWAAATPAVNRPRRGHTAGVGMAHSNLGEAPRGYDGRTERAVAPAQGACVWSDATGVVGAGCDPRERLSFGRLAGGSRSTASPTSRHPIGIESTGVVVAGTDRDEGAFWGITLAAVPITTTPVATGGSAGLDDAGAVRADVQVEG